MSADAQVDPLQISLVQLHGLMRGVLRRFRHLTGLTAVSSVARHLPASGQPPALTPCLHPACARRLRSVGDPPCGRHWAIHERSLRRCTAPRTHKCALGLRCGAIPVRLTDRTVGIVKVAADARTPDKQFSRAMVIIKILVEKASRDARIGALDEEVADLRHRLSDLASVASRNAAPLHPSAVADGQAACGRRPNGALVDRALAILHENYGDPDLSLAGLAALLGCNPRYLTARFTRTTGQRMHAYLLGLRVDHARRLLLSTGGSVKEIAFASGFHGASQMNRVFRRMVGAPPRSYRRIFSAS